MRILTDWKFWLTTLAAIAGVVVPVWLWRADLHSRSLQVRLVSQTSLQPELKGSKTALSVVVDGNTLRSPFLSVLEIVNNGSRPIPASDFEGSIEVRGQVASSLMRADVTSTSPKSLQPQVTISENVVRVSPLLLNPEDSMTVAVISANEPPQLAVRARIAGVYDLKIEDGTKSKTGEKVGWASLFFGFLLLVVSFTTSDTKRGGDYIELRSRAATFIFAVAGMAGVLCVAIFGIAMDMDGFWQLIGAAVGVAIPSALVASLLNARTNRTTPPPSAP